MAVLLREMKPDQLFDELTYLQYCSSRKSAPDITPRSWSFVYGPAVDAMEARYQLEKASAESAYVRAGIEKAQRERWEGKDDAPGSDVFGRPLDFGS